MIQWEEVELMDATHVEINGEVHELKVGGKVEKSGGVSIGGFHSIDILVGMNDWANIPQEAFPILGIRCLRKFKPTPIEFKATFVSYDGNWRLLDCLEDGFAYQNNKKAKFKCVEILEDEE
jgi:hypothetical protein